MLGNELQKLTADVCSDVPTKRRVKPDYFPLASPLSFFLLIPRFGLSKTHFLGEPAGPESLLINWCCVVERLRVARYARHALAKGGWEIPQYARRVVAGFVYKEGAVVWLSKRKVPATWQVERDVEEVRRVQVCLNRYSQSVTFHYFDDVLSCGIGIVTGGVYQGCKAVISLEA